MTEEYLSTRQVQLRLNVDRTTIYRMLNYGRLRGVKVGRQWHHREKQGQILYSDLQGLLDVLAEVLGVSLQGVAKNGENLTAISNPCRFCRLIQESKSGAHACRAQWARMAENPPGRNFSTCHAGLQYAQVPIITDGTAIGMMFAGQFLLQAPDNRSNSQTIDRLASEHNLDKCRLVEAAADLTVLPWRQKTLIWDWLEKIATSFSDFHRKQQALNHRLKQIAQMCELFY